MASSGSGYDLSSSTFSPDGRIFQIEYAQKAVENAGTCLGLTCVDGVVMAVEKPLQHKMLLEASNRRIHTVDTHAGVAMTGFISDARQVKERAREEAANYEETYGLKIPPTVLADRMGSYVHYFTLHGALRPFGATVMLAAYDPETKEHSLSMVEPSGVVYQYFACAAGKGRQPSKTELEKLQKNYATVSASVSVSVDTTSTFGGEQQQQQQQQQQHDDSNNNNNKLLTVQEGVKQLARIIHMLHQENKDKPFELEMSWLSEKETNWQHEGVPKDVIAAAVEWAKQDIAASQEADDDDDDDDNDGDDNDKDKDGADEMMEE